MFVVQSKLPRGADHEDHKKPSHIGQQAAVSLFEKFAGLLVAKLPKKTQPFFLSLLLGALLAIARRRTVTRWSKAAQICDKYRDKYFTISPTSDAMGGEVQSLECADSNPCKKTLLDYYKSLLWEILPRTVRICHHVTEN